MNVTNCCLCNSSNLKKVVTLGSSGLANNLEQLNKVYANMLTAMNPNK